MYSRGWAPNSGPLGIFSFFFNTPFLSVASPTNAASAAHIGGAWSVFRLLLFCVFPNVRMSSRPCTPCIILSISKRHSCP